MNCEEVKKWMIDDQPGDANNAAVRKHLETCETCRESVQSMEWVKARTRPMVSVDIPPLDSASFTNRVMSSLDAQGTVTLRTGWTRVLDSVPVSFSLMAASLLLAGLLVFELWRPAQVPVGGLAAAGPVVNQRSFQQNLNRLRQTPAFRAGKACRNPYRKPEVTAQCIRQKYTAFQSL